MSDESVSWLFFKAKILLKNTSYKDKKSLFLSGGHKIFRGWIFLLKRKNFHTTKKWFPFLVSYLLLTFYLSHFFLLYSLNPSAKSFYISNLSPTSDYDVFITDCIEKNDLSTRVNIQTLRDGNARFFFKLTSRVRVEFCLFLNYLLYK